MKHIWVKHVVTHVYPLADITGEPVILVDPDDQITAEDKAAYGCDRCGEAFSTEGFYTECKGEQSEND